MSSVDLDLHPLACVVHLPACGVDLAAELGCGIPLACRFRIGRALRGERCCGLHPGR